MYWKYENTYEIEMLNLMLLYSHFSTFKSLKFFKVGNTDPDQLTLSF